MSSFVQEGERCPFCRHNSVTIIDNFGLRRTDVICHACGYTAASVPELNEHNQHKLDDQGKAIYKHTITEPKGILIIQANPHSTRTIRALNQTLDDAEVQRIRDQARDEQREIFLLTRWKDDHLEILAGDLSQAILNNQSEF
jgi:hypothetical protein